jgi:hypothetical protein
MKSIFRQLHIIVLAVGVLSCNNNANNAEEQRADSTEAEVVNEDIAAIADAFPDIYHFFSVTDSTFSPDKFIEVSRDTLANEPESVVGPVLKEYFPYFIFNNDSSFAIDLYSYNISFTTRNGKTKVEEMGPDTEVGLVDMENKTRRRIFFGGTSAVVMDAEWLNNRAFLLMTGENITEKEFIPTITRINLTDNSVKRFVYDDTLKVEIANYKDRRLGAD